MSSSSGCPHCPHCRAKELPECVSVGQVSYPIESTLIPFESLSDDQRKDLLAVWHESLNKALSGEYPTVADMAHVDFAKAIFVNALTSIPNDRTIVAIRKRQGKDNQGFLLAEDGIPVAIRIYHWTTTGYKRRCCVDLDFTLFHGTKRDAFRKMWQLMLERPDDYASAFVQTNDFFTPALAQHSCDARERATLVPRPADSDKFVSDE